MDISNIYKIMIALERKFLKEIERIDVMHTDIECDMEYMKDYLDVHQTWRTYNNMSDIDVLKSYYYDILIKRLNYIKERYGVDVEVDDETAAHANESIEIEQVSPYGFGKFALEEMNRDDLTRLYNSGMMPMPIDKYGRYDFSTKMKIMDKIRYGYY